MMKPLFTDPKFIREQLARTLRFYDAVCVDAQGGFFHYFKDDGTVYDAHNRHVVSSTRFVFNYAMAYRHTSNPAYLANVRHGLAYLRNAHRQPHTGGYAWTLRQDGARTTVVDATNYAYAVAFVMLAYAQGVLAGVDEARAWLEETWALAETRFWEEAHGLYADEASPDWATRSPYRGQNANMHWCEALLCAFDATGAPKYLQRAYAVAHHITQRQAALTGGLIWEHYRSDWSVDADYNRHDRSNPFKPWGYQPGHLAEWAKLLLILERTIQRCRGLEPHFLLNLDTTWLLPRARALFDAAWAGAWDLRHGGLHYGFAPDGSLCHLDKYHWVQAEALAAAALLGTRTGEAVYWQAYEKLWAYCWAHFVDHQHGAWFRMLSPDNQKLSDAKSPAGKTDYHNMGACYEVLRALPAADAPDGLGRASY